MGGADAEQFYTVPQAARLLQVSAVTVWRWIEARQLPAYRVGPRNIRIKKADLETMVQPARAKEATVQKERMPIEPATQAELARRKDLVAKILCRRQERVITPTTTADLVHKAREEETRSYGQ